MPTKKILCLDFDGVLHSYSTPWISADKIPDPPVEGAIDFLWKAQEVFKVYIYSSRSGQSGGIEAMREWIAKWDCLLFPERFNEDGLKLDEILWFTKEKPPAHVTIDDRALTFTGIFPSIESLIDFKPWNKKVK